MTDEIFRTLFFAIRSLLDRARLRSLPEFDASYGTIVAEPKQQYEVCFAIDSRTSIGETGGPTCL